MKPRWKPIARMTIVMLFVRSPAAAAERPNIVLIYADDIGYGDFSCYGATAVRTPNVDRVAREGLRFTDAHSPAATCTPSATRCSGEYAWRQKGTNILPGDAPLIIEPGRVTLASMLHDAGYATGVVGKWHLGLGRGHPDWNADLKPGPLQIGFDYCYIIPATGDRVPCVFVENHRVVGYDSSDPIQISYGKKVGNEPTGAERPDLLTMKPSHGHANTIINGISRIGFSGRQIGPLARQSHRGHAHATSSEIHSRPSRQAFLPLLCDPRHTRASRPKPAVSWSTTMGPRRRHRRIRLEPRTGPRHVGPPRPG